MLKYMKSKGFDDPIESGQYCAGSYWYELPSIEINLNISVSSVGKHF